jgi:hypothetical protein
VGTLSFRQTVTHGAFFSRSSEFSGRSWKNALTLLRVSTTLTGKKLRLMGERDVEMKDEGDSVGESDDDDDEMGDGGN